MNISNSKIVNELLPLVKILGLSNLDIKVYMTLLINGPLTARRLAELLSIPSTKVYEPLNRLLEKKFIDKSHDRPAIYSARPPREVWDEIKHKIIELMDSIEKYIIPQLEVIAHGASQPYQITIIPQENIVREIKLLILKSKSNVDAALSFPELIVDDIINALIEASKTKRVRILITSSMASLVDKIKNEFIYVKVLNDMFGSGIIGDAVILVVRTPSGILNAMWSSHKYFNEIARVYFDYLWGKAKGLS